MKTEVNAKIHINPGKEADKTNPAANAAPGGCSQPNRAISKVDKKTASPQNKIE
jgi:hypothetical protein